MPKGHLADADVNIFLMDHDGSAWEHATNPCDPEYAHYDEQIRAAIAARHFAPFKENVGKVIANNPDSINELGFFSTRDCLLVDLLNSLEKPDCPSKPSTVPFIKDIVAQLQAAGLNINFCAFMEGDLYPDANGHCDDGREAAAIAACLDEKGFFVPAKVIASEGVHNFCAEQLQPSFSTLQAMLEDESGWISTGSLDSSKLLKTIIAAHRAAEKYPGKKIALHLSDDRDDILTNILAVSPWLIPSNVTLIAYKYATSDQATYYKETDIEIPANPTFHSVGKVEGLGQFNKFWRQHFAVEIKKVAELERYFSYKYKMLSGFRNKSSEEISKNVPANVTDDLNRHIAWQILRNFMKHLAQHPWSIFKGKMQESMQVFTAGEIKLFELSSRLASWEMSLYKLKIKIAKAEAELQACSANDYLRKQDLHKELQLLRGSLAGEQVFFERDVQEIEQVLGDISQALNVTHAIFLPSLDADCATSNSAEWESLLDQAMQLEMIFECQHQIQQHLQLLLKKLQLIDNDSDLTAEKAPDYTVIRNKAFALDLREEIAYLTNITQSVLSIEKTREVLRCIESLHQKLTSVSCSNLQLFSVENALRSNLSACKESLTNIMQFIGKMLQVFKAPEAPAQAKVAGMVV